MTRTTALYAMSLAFVLLVADRLLKILVVTSGSIWLADGVVLGPVYNSNLPGTMGTVEVPWLPVMMPAAYLIAIVIIAIIAQRDRAGAIGLTILAIGLISNAADMLIYPGVVDPIGIRVADPVFVGTNIADAYIGYGIIRTVYDIRH